MSKSNNVASSSSTAAVLPFLKTSLSSIHKLCGSQKKLGLVKTECKAVLDLIAQHEKSSSHPVPAENGGPDSAAIKQQQQRATRYFTPLKLACETKNAKLIEVSLDCIQKLIAFGFFEDHQSLNQVISTVICPTYEGFQDNEHIELQVLKALLTAVTSIKVFPTGDALMQTLRTSFAINVITKSDVNAKTSIATLRQMITTVFARLESGPSVCNPIVGSPSIADSVPASPFNDVSIPTTPTTTTATTFAAASSSAAAAAASSSAITAVSEDQSSTDGSHGDEVTPRDSGSAIDKEEELTAEVDSSVEQQQAPTNHVEPQQTSIKDVKPAKNGDEPQEEAAEHAEDTLQKDVHDYVDGLLTDIVAKQDTASGASTPRTPSSTSISTPPSLPQKVTQSRQSARYDHFTPSQRDVFFFFQELSTLRYASKLLPKRSSDEQNLELALRHKMLSLDLVLSIIDKSGPVFLSMPDIVTAIRNYLCPALLRLTVSTHRDIFGLTLSIWSSLLTHFRLHLKREICVFFSTLGRLLECSFTAHWQRMMIIDTIDRVFQHPQLVMDLFVSFDCDIDSPNLVEDAIVSPIARLVQLAHAEFTSQGSGASSDIEIKQRGVQSLVLLLKALAVWTHNRRETPEVTPTVSAPSTVFTSLGDSKRLKHEVDKGITIFNTLLNNQALYSNAQKGIQFLLDHQLIPSDSATDIAHFLYDHRKRLHKSQLGEYVAEKENEPILRDFIELLDFHNLNFDQSMRLLLSTFRLPGESQKVERVVKSFAPRFHACHPGLFSQAETAMVLAYSFTMLHTDLHTPILKTRMTKAEWVRLNRGIDNDKDLPSVLLEEIYDSVSANEIRITDPITVDGPVMDSEAKKRKIEAQNDPVKRFSYYKMETESIIQQNLDLLQSEANEDRTMKTTNDVNVAREVFVTIWVPTLALFSLLMEDPREDAPRIISLCLEGFEHGIHISSSLFAGLETERTAFISGLGKFTFLSNLREMKDKNIKSIQLLLKLALQEANHLHSSWLDVLKCISQLERLQLIGSGAPETVFGDLQSNRRSDPMRKSSVQLVRNAPPSARRSAQSSLEEINSMSVVEQIDSEIIDRIFENSAQLDGNAIVDVVNNLCVVSREEITASSGYSNQSPRMFSLQKLVEMGHFNVHRSRDEWLRIWQSMSAHFSSVGCHSNLQIAMYAVDSLRQLAIKVLSHDAKRNLQQPSDEKAKSEPVGEFQGEFLAPFAMLISETKATEIKEMIVQCIEQVIVTNAAGLSSAWKQIFTILRIAASDSSESVVTASFRIIERILADHYVLVTHQEIVSCLLEFGSNSRCTNISTRAVAYLRTVAQHIVDQYTSSSAVSESTPFVFQSENQVHVGAWSPMLSGLARLVWADSRAEVRQCASNVFVDILSAYGQIWDRGMWNLVYGQMYLHIFKDVRRIAEAVQMPLEEIEWVKTTCNTYLSSVVATFSHYYAQVSFLLPDVLDMFVNCVSKSSENLSRMGIVSLLQIVKTCGRDFTSDVWTSVCNTLSSIFHNIQISEENLQALLEKPVLPNNGSTDSLSSAPSSPTSKRPPHPMLKYVVTAEVSQHLLIESVHEIIATLYEPCRQSMQTSQFKILTTALHKTYAQFSSLNESDELRLLLLKHGYESVLRNLIVLETNSLAVYLRILLRLFIDQKSPERQQFVESELISACQEVIQRYLAKSMLMPPSPVDETPTPRPAPSNATPALPQALNEVEALAPVIVLVLQGFHQFSNDQFSRYIGTFFDMFATLVLSNKHDIRLVLRDVLLRIGNHCNIAAASNSTLSRASST